MPASASPNACLRARGRTRSKEASRVRLGGADQPFASVGGLRCLHAALGIDLEHVEQLEVEPLQSWRYEHVLELLAPNELDDHHGPRRDVDEPVVVEGCVRREHAQRRSPELRHLAVRLPSRLIHPSAPETIPAGMVTTSMGGSFTGSTSPKICSTT